MAKNKNDFTKIKESFKNGSNVSDEKLEEYVNKCKNLERDRQKKLKERRA